MQSSLSPYLNFNGNAAEAMKFYQSVLGGELTMQTFGETNMAKKPDEKNKIVHAVLKSEALVLMASDVGTGMHANFGDNVHMSLTGQDKEKLTEVFIGLSRGGKVNMPLAKQFWGDTFGMLTDKFGVHWMVNIASEARR